MVPGVSCLAGSVGIGRGGNVAAGFQPDPTAAGHSGLRIGSDGISFPLKASANGGQPSAVLVYPTDRILSGSSSSPRVRSSGQSGLVELRFLRWSAHNGGNIGVSDPSMRRSWIPRLGAISVLAPRSPVRPSWGEVGARRDPHHGLAARQENPANGFQLVDSLRRSRRGGPGGGCFSSFGCGRALPFGLGGSRFSRSVCRARRVRTSPTATLERVVREDRSFL